MFRIAALVVNGILLSVMSVFAIADEQTSSGEIHEHLNELALFVGVTHEEGENEPSIGLEYERRLSERFGVGAIIEYTGGDSDSTVYAAPLFVHLSEPWKLVFAPGFEHSDGDDEFLFRTGIQYGIEMDAWSITPNFNIDFVDGETNEILGVSFGRGF
jgi:hypothetical protein